MQTQELKISSEGKTLVESNIAFDLKVTVLATLVTLIRIGKPKLLINIF